MGGASAIYLKAEENGECENIIRRFPTARSFGDSSYYAVEYELEDDGQSIGKFIKISEEMKLDLIGMCWHSSMDWFAYFNIKNGEVKRHLVRGEAEWLISYGTKEEWEDDIIFGNSKTELEYIEDDFKNKLIEREEYEKIKKMYEKKEIEEKNFFPMITAYDAAEAVSLKYRLPDWIESMENGYVAEEYEEEEVINKRVYKKWWQFWK